MNFGATLRLLRTDAGISLRALAQEIGVSSAYLSRVENGHDAAPTTDRLLAIARALRLPSMDLIELAHKVMPFVSSYQTRRPEAGALFAEIARRNLSGVELARIQAFIDAEFPARSPQGALTPPRLSALLAPERVVLGLSCTHFEDVLDVAAARLAPDCGEASTSEVAQALLRREQEASSTLGEGVAVPHAIVPSLSPRAALVTLSNPLDVPTPDGIPLRLFIVVAFQSIGAKHLHMLAQVATLASRNAVDALAGMTEPREAVRAVARLGV